MKSLVFSILFVVLVLFLATSVASAQMPGRWVQCIDPASGYTVQCFIPDQAVPVYQTQPVYSQEPVYQTQQRKTVRQDYDVGISPYSRRPYGHYSRSTERTTITVETNAPNYQPNIVVTYGSGYYYPYYRNW